MTNLMQSARKKPLFVLISVQQPCSSTGSYTLAPLRYRIVTVPIFAAGLTLILFNPQTVGQGNPPHSLVKKGKLELPLETKGRSTLFNHYFYSFQSVLLTREFSHVNI